MARVDIGDATLALLTGFILSAGITGFILSAGGYQMPMAAHSGMAQGAGPGMMAPAFAPAASAQGQGQAASAYTGAATADLKILATDLKFTPPTIQAKVGQPIKLTLENRGVIEHDIAFPTIQADKPAASLRAVARPGQSTALEFTPTAAGSFEYVCTIPGHKEAGMKGTITVSP